MLVCAKLNAIITDIITDWLQPAKSVKEQAEREQSRRPDHLVSGGDGGERREIASPRGGEHISETN